MIKSSALLGCLKRKGFTFYSGVPCSIFEKLLEAVLKDRRIRYVPAVRENAALGVASGAYLAGNRACVIMQNSGLGNIINALTSFNLIYKIPVLILISWRGFGGRDAPEHIVMGKKTVPLLEELEIPNRVLGEDYKKDIDWALGKMEKMSVPVALIVKDGSIG